MAYYSEYSPVLEERQTRPSHLKHFRQAILRCIRQAILKSKLQMRDPCLSLSTREYSGLTIFTYACIYYILIVTCI